MNIWIDSKTPKEIVYDFCKTSETETSDSAKANYSTENWDTNPATLMYKLYIEKIYDVDNRGSYIASTNGTDLITGGGLCQWNEDPNVGIYLSRLFTHRDYRGKPEARLNHLEFDLFDRAKELGYKAIISTFNDYNKRLMETTYQVNNPDRFPNYYYDGVNHYVRQGDRRIIPVEKLDYQITVNYTKQWALYCLLDPSYEIELFQKFSELKA